MFNGAAISLFARKSSSNFFVTPDEELFRYPEKRRKSEHCWCMTGHVYVVNQRSSRAPLLSIDVSSETRTLIMLYQLDQLCVVFNVCTIAICVRKRKVCVHAKMEKIFPRQNAY